jgi:hypothetical protein
MKSDCVLIILACLFCFSAHAQDEWAIGQFVDQEGNILDIYFIQFTGVIDSRYSHTFADNQLMKIKNMRFSLVEGLYFETTDTVGYSSDSNIQYAIKPDEKEQLMFRASYTSYPSRGTGMILLRYSDEILEALVAADLVGMGFRTNMGFTCTFDFPPGFKEAYEMLLSEINK